MKKLFLYAVVSLLAACSSGVKLDNVQVEDRTGSGAGVAGGVGGAGMNGRGLDGLKPGPAGVANVVYFDYDSFTVKPESQSVLEAHARFLRADASRRANLEGHTDERGGREYNLALGQKRAEAVRRALGALGVSDAQMEAVSFGKEKPADSAGTEAAFAKNRRVELTYR
jgi:peptidoglycan-associated lipoprotein